MTCCWYSLVSSAKCIDQKPSDSRSPSSRVYDCGRRHKARKKTPKNATSDGPKSTRLTLSPANKPKTTTSTHQTKRWNHPRPPRRKNTLSACMSDLPSLTTKASTLSRRKHRLRLAVVAACFCRNTTWQQTGMRSCAAQSSYAMRATSRISKRISSMLGSATRLSISGYDPFMQYGSFVLELSPN